MEMYCILDCFVDEPACFGVPPFLSPYPRYLYGALVDAGVDSEKIRYSTIETLRENEYRLPEAFSQVFLIGGAVVPGKYLGSRIGTLREVERIIANNSGTGFAIGGLISHLIPDGLPGVTLVRADIEKFAFHTVRGDPHDMRRDYRELSRWAVQGAAVVRQHPSFPNLICEIETYRGCPRKTHCSFCSEYLFREITFRDGQDIIDEIEALIEKGIRRFRIGRQADILQYQTPRRKFKKGFPQPDPKPIIELFSALREKRLRGEIAVLNIDNANPGTIYHFPDESSRILEAIADAVTPGDTIALGVESFDTAVIAQNNLKVNRDELIAVLTLINRIGGKRVNDIPVLLPGINLIHGLIGETANTFKINYESLLDIRDRGLLVKRINIRKILIFPGTRAAGEVKRISESVRKRYDFFREKIRKEIEHDMLTRIYPTGAILRDLLVLEHRFDYSYAKQIASYSITAKIPVPLPLQSLCDVIVTGHRERSLIALPYPIAINAIPQKAMEHIPGIGRKLASRLIVERPLQKREDITDIAPHLDRKISDAIRF